MRHQSSGRRSRNRGGNRRGSNNRSQVFDSNGPDVRIRGTAHQIHEKYMALAKDAAGCGDRIVEESYLQHAEHYQRIINSWQEEAQETRQNGTTDERADDNAAESSRPAPRERAPSQPVARKDDLGLPSSITGADAKQEELEGA